ILDHQQLIWVKPTPVFGRVYWHFRHEPCVMGWRKGSMPPHDGQHEFTSVWTVDWDGKARVVGNEHPTEKPVELFARPMRKHTQVGDLCFEPFSGSGSQLIAAERERRRRRAGGVLGVVHAAQRGNAADGCDLLRYSALGAQDAVPLDIDALVQRPADGDAHHAPARPRDAVGRGLAPAVVDADDRRA
ncbi:MAG: hypothetical protein JNK70_14540, partial [Phycisphaerae bacterium]|nr:hypothetical protein [Phycisphaerae bacterium]